jgi:hypothetical protein
VLVDGMATRCGLVEDARLALRIGPFARRTRGGARQAPKEAGRLPAFLAPEANVRVELRAPSR